MSFWSIAFLGSTTIGGPVVGWFGQVAGARWGLAIGGMAAIVAALLGLRFLLVGRAKASQRLTSEVLPSPVPLKNHWKASTEDEVKDTQAVHLKK